MLARVTVRVREMLESIRLAEAAPDRLPDGPLCAVDGLPPIPPGEACTDR